MDMTKGRTRSHVVSELTRSVVCYRRLASGTRCTCGQPGRSTTTSRSRRRKPRWWGDPWAHPRLTCCGLQHISSPHVPTTCRTSPPRTARHTPLTPAPTLPPDPSKLLVSYWTMTIILIYVFIENSTCLNTNQLNTCKTRIACLFLDRYVDWFIQSS